MKIKELKINNFGNLTEKEIKFSDNVNIVYGKNESGKSTLLKFIVGMFYGISKNKNNKFMPDYDRYLPWNGKEFSGKITYKLDDCKQYEVFRDFSKKNPKILDENFEDISKTYTIDKTKGNQFFSEQVNVDEETFLSTIVTEQTEVRLNEKEQNSLLQRISNLMGTGDDNTSFSRTMNKLNKKLLEEVGTQKSQDRPINVKEREIRELTSEKNNLMSYLDEKYTLEENEVTEKEKYEQGCQEVEFLNEIKMANDERKIALGQFEISNDFDREYNLKCQSINSQLEQYRNEIENEKKLIEKRKSNGQVKDKKISKAKILFTMCGIVSIALIIMAICLENNVLKLVSIVPILVTIWGMGGVIIAGKVRRKEHEEAQVLQYRLSELEGLSNGKKEEILIVEKVRDDRLKEINVKKHKIIEKFDIKFDTITQKFMNMIDKQLVEKVLNSVNVERISNKTKNNGEILELKFMLEKRQKEVNESRLKLHTIELDKNNMLPRLEKLASIEEKLKDSSEEYEELKRRSKIINLAIEELKIADLEAKSNITPKFAMKLSENINRISNGKYKNVRLNNEKGLIVEVSNGDYISAENLSVGTIDQLYLSLRLATCEEISKEKLPIILDESFAYYDSVRLKNILEYLSYNYADRQIIIFSCTNRECEILDSCNIAYNLIKL